MEIPDCLEHPLLLTNGPGSYYVPTIGFIRDIRSIIMNCDGLWFPYKLNGEWYVNMQSGGGRKKRAVVKRSLYELIINENWEVRLGSGS